VPGGRSAVDACGRCLAPDDDTAPPCARDCTGKFVVRKPLTDGTIDGFLGPFVGLAITGFNDLGFSRLEGVENNPEVCAAKCLATDGCKSIDFGTREAQGDEYSDEYTQGGECWLSTATRASAGEAFTSWPTYDYYETTPCTNDPGDSLPVLGDNQVLCGDGTIVNDWVCSPDRGGRHRCPPNMPFLCNKQNDCGGGLDRCCEAAEVCMASKDGIAPCPGRTFQTTDACGVCGGDGSSCLDCAGNPPTDGSLPAKEDRCGVCDNDPTNDNMRDCFGICIHGQPLGVMDVCGTCDGRYCSSNGRRNGIQPGTPPTEGVAGAWECAAGLQLLEIGDGVELSCADCAGETTAMGCRLDGSLTAETPAVDTRGMWACDIGKPWFAWRGPNAFDHCGQCDADKNNDCTRDCTGRFKVNDLDVTACTNTALDIKGLYDVLKQSLRDGPEQLLAFCGPDHARHGNTLEFQGSQLMCIELLTYMREDTGHMDCGLPFLSLDDCGVCGGDNTLCTDCAGNTPPYPGGLPAKEDRCGVCDNDPTNDNMRDCFGICIYGQPLGVMDVCGICDGRYCSSNGKRNGIDAERPPTEGICATGLQLLEIGDGADELSCTDCAGSTTPMTCRFNGADTAETPALGPHGMWVCDVGKPRFSWHGPNMKDHCGQCDDSKENDCGRDCTGRFKVDNPDVVDDFLIEDVCHVCGGDGSSCLDCAGNPPSTDGTLSAKKDRCGVCDNDPTNDNMRDCFGICIPVGVQPAVTDACGTCDGRYCSSNGRRNGIQPGTPPTEGVAGAWECAAGLQLLEIGDGAELGCADCAGETTAMGCRLDGSLTAETPALGARGMWECDAGHPTKPWRGPNRLDKCGQCDDSKENDCARDCEGEFRAANDPARKALDDCDPPTCGGDGVCKIARQVPVTLPGVLLDYVEAGGAPKEIIGRFVTAVAAQKQLAEEDVKVVELTTKADPIVAAAVSSVTGPTSELALVDDKIPDGTYAFETISSGNFVPPVEFLWLATVDGVQTATGRAFTTGDELATVTGAFESDNGNFFIFDVPETTNDIVVDVASKRYRICNTGLGGDFADYATDSYAHCEQSWHNAGGTSSGSVTLAAEDASIVAGQRLRLTSAEGQTCAGVPLDEDLEVASVDGATVSFTVGTTAGSDGTGCVVTRAGRVAMVIELRMPKAEGEEAGRRRLAEVGSGIAGELGLDASDIPVGPPTDLVIDCLGVTGGTAYIDECGVCGVPAIAGATVSNIIACVDEACEAGNTVTLDVADASIAASQTLRLSSADGQTCAAVPLDVDLAVDSVDGAVITLASGIITTGSDGAHCVLIRRSLCSDCAGVHTAMYCSTDGTAAGTVATTPSRTDGGGWECTDGSTVVFASPGASSNDGCGTCDADDSNDCIANCLGEIGGAGYAGAGLLPNVADPLLDTCEVCEGDDTTCMDCAGTADTDTTNDAARDDCGTCDTDAGNDCVADCAGRHVYCTTAEIADAVIISMVDADNKITLAESDDSIDAGQLLRLSSVDGQTCGALPLDADLTVASVDGFNVVLVTEITGTASNCVLSRAAGQRLVEEPARASSLVAFECTSTNVVAAALTPGGVDPLLDACNLRRRRQHVHGLRRRAGRRRGRGRVRGLQQRRNRRLPAGLPGQLGPAAALRVYYPESEPVHAGPGWQPGLP
jgi:hypothetical protein